MVEAEADAEGDSPVYYSLRIFDTEWLRDRREIRSFFTQEVDRDKIVLWGERLDAGGELGTSPPAQEEAERYVVGAGHFLAAVEQMLSG